MYAIPVGLFVVGALVGLALGYVIGKLWGELKVLRELMERRRRTQSDIALFEDALAVVTDLTIRQQVEVKRSEAVSNYFYVRMAHLSELLGQGRNGFDYKSKPAKRPKDY
jgi:hypothetical protein